MGLEGEDLFDEFGNYIGPDEPNQLPKFDGHVEDDREGYETIQGDLDDTHQQSFLNLADASSHGQIVLFEDKKNYSSALETYGPSVETLVQDEDTQPLSEPIIAPVRVKHFQTLLNAPPPHSLLAQADEQFLSMLMACPSRVHRLVVCGSLHHGKTRLLDLILQHGHTLVDPKRPAAPVVADNLSPWFMDSLLIEQQRCISLRAKPACIIGRDAHGTTHLLHLLDTPGHVDFIDEVALGLEMARDGGMVLLVVDAVEGVLDTTERLLRLAVSKKLPILLIVNKVERLWMELCLPPNDAYHKLRHLIDRTNTILTSILEAEKLSSYTPSFFQPEIGNVLFASASFGWIFNLKSFAERVLCGKNMGISQGIPDSLMGSLGLPTNFGSSLAKHPNELGKILWGDLYLGSDGKLRKRPSTKYAPKRTFVTFVLEPLYKIYTQCLGEDPEHLEPVLASIGIKLTKKQYKMDMKPLLSLVLSRLFGGTSCVGESLIESILLHKRPCIDRNGQGNFSGWLGKLYPNPAATGFDALVRIDSGVLKEGDHIKILGMDSEASADRFDDEMVRLEVVRGLHLGCTRYNVPVREVPCGNWALISLSSAPMGSTAWLFGDGSISDCSFIPFEMPTKSLVKIAVEPWTPSELPKMLDGLRAICRTYPSLVTRVEESGEHVLLGTGELYLDSAMHDLRTIHGDLEVRLADPAVRLAETVVETSMVRCHADTPNGRCRVSLIAEPLSEKILAALEAGILPQPRQSCESDQRLAKMLMDLGWDKLAARSVWAFGPDEKRGPNILLEECIDEDLRQPVRNNSGSDGSFPNQRAILEACREPIAQGFQWATREGPLCEEPIRGVLFRLVGASFPPEPALRTGGQVIPTVRRACYSAFLTAAPRILEPVNRVEMLSPRDCQEAIYALLAKRRGHITLDEPVSGTPMYRQLALLPTIESFGFETDLRVTTVGAAHFQHLFSTWQIVPGDPLDSTIKLIPLEPSPAPHLARDFMLKTRRRKGLTEEVSITKYFDDPSVVLLELASQEAAQMSIR